MSPKNQVGHLCELCSSLVSRQLILALSDYEGRNHKTVENYINNTTGQIAESLLRRILKSENLDAATRYNCLDILLRREVKELETGIFPHSYHEAILNIITDKGTGIRYLNLKGVWVHDYLNQLCQVIRSLEKIKVLIIPHMANNQILDTLKMSSFLTILDISGECYFTEHELSQFRCENLKILSIGYYGKRNICVQESHDYSVIADLILNLPNLVALKIYSFTGEALLRLNQFNRDYKSKFKYLHDTGTSVVVIMIIVKMCPDLEIIHLDTPEDGVITKLVDLRRLDSLVLTKFKIQDLLKFLQISGEKIESLKLNHVKDSSLDLSFLALSTPNLKNLSLFQMIIFVSQIDLPLKSLEKVEILYTELQESTIRYICGNSPLLKKIIVGSAISMTDGDIFRLCAQCDFVFLEEIWFSSARGLTITSVKLLMGHCPKLKILGKLDGWDVQFEEVECLRAVIKSTNTDLTLFF